MSKPDPDNATRPKTVRPYQHCVIFSQARQLVKDGFLVEVSESSRKVRHVFLFTDLLLCAKMKKTAVG